jgi:predicted AAA+ superfamily ATPase
LIEIRKNQLLLLPKIMAQIAKNPLKFIIFIDDLSFNKNDDNFSMLKATLEGSASAKAKNAVIYATSNRRHLIKETWKDRTDSEINGDIHRSETIEEKLSLVNRFGLSIGYFKPTHTEFDNIVLELAAKHPEITMSREQILAEAHAWEMRNGGISGRTAQQFVNHLCGIH